MPLTAEQQRARRASKRAAVDVVACVGHLSEGPEPMLRVNFAVGHKSAFKTHTKRIARRNAIFCVVLWNDHRHLLRPWDKVHLLWGECDGPCSVLSGQRELTPIAAASGTSRSTQGVRCDGVEHGRSLVPGSRGGREGGTCRCEPFRRPLLDRRVAEGSEMHRRSFWRLAQDARGTL